MRKLGLLTVWCVVGTAAFSGCVGAPVDSALEGGEPIASDEQALPTDGQVCITVQQGGSGSAEDAVIWQSAPDWNDGARSPLSTGSSTLGLRQSLLRHDLAGVPAGATVLSATLAVYQLYKTTETTVSVHRVTTPWSAADVTWSSFGGGFDAAAAGSFVSGDPSGEAFGFRAVDLTGLTQGWVDDSSSNYGVLLEEPVGDFTDYRSSESLSVSERPKLDLCYVTCDDGIQNGSETGVDCGGACGSCPLLSEDFSDNALGWTLGPEWQIGSATASSGGAYGADPAADHTDTGDNGVAGVVIGGNASTSLHGFYYLTSPAFDASGEPGSLTLSFHRWLNSDYAPYMKNTVEVWSGSGWVTLWSSGGPPSINDNAWTLIQHDLTSYKNANMQIRFGFNITSNGVFSIGSWNLDDVLVSGRASSL